MITQDVPPFSRIVTERETQNFRRECHRTGTPGFLCRASEDVAARVSHAAAFEAQHHTGAGALRVDFADSDDVLRARKIYRSR